MNTASSITFVSESLYWWNHLTHAQRQFIITFVEKWWKIRGEKFDNVDINTAYNYQNNVGWHHKEGWPALSFSQIAGLSS